MRDSSSLKTVSVAQLLRAMMRLPSQNHGICHICALKLVEAENVSLLSDIGRDVWYAIDINTVLHFESMQSPVYVLHEIVEVNATFRLD
jgi:hypothetical protein